MDVAVKYEPKDCFLYEECQGEIPEGMGGWRKELNGTEIQKRKELSKQHLPGTG